jgi:hypothetical protein
MACCCCFCNFDKSSDNFFFIIIKILHLYENKLKEDLPTSLIKVWVKPKIPEFNNRLTILLWWTDIKIPMVTKINLEWGSAPRLNLSWKNKNKPRMRQCSKTQFLLKRKNITSKQFVFAYYWQMKVLPHATFSYIVMSFSV